MPITPSKGFATTDGRFFACLEGAQQEELKRLLIEQKFEELIAHNVAGWMVHERDAVLDILALGPRSRVASRKRAGTTNPRRAAARAKVVGEFNEAAGKAAAAMRERVARATLEQAAAGFKAAREAAEAATT